MASDDPSSKVQRASAVAVKKTADCSISNGKNQSNSSKKIHKAEREKLKRDRLNELFQELSRDLDPLGLSSCKASILADATRALRDLLARRKKLRDEHTALVSESHYITLERDELQAENLTLKSDIGMLQNELNQMLRCSSDDTRLVLAQSTTIPDPQQHHNSAASLVQRPQARYPSPSDSWPAKLLSGLPGPLQGQEQELHASTRIIEVDN
ncbi:transcription factor bHLH47-like [Phalaenopsis equestris]|uniref:transcription factor bHLH47-like n=1 Tax=Phalaenopsis equestris TaxID=78828 RepID=UPI0009E6117C|nr:transcription factor bHLH47-like [Phalaenopsis equestris]